MAEYVDLQVTDGTRMRAWVARPTGIESARGMLVFQEAFGVNHHIRAVTERFAGAGYVAIAPELFHRTAPGFEGDYTDFNAVMPHYKALTREGLAADAAAAHAWLAGPGGCAAERVAAVGFCLGGRVAILAAGTLPLRAAASFYGGDLPSLRDVLPRVHGRLLIGWGDRDTHIPPAQRQEFIELCRQAKTSFIEATYGDAGHGFLCDERAAYHAPSARIAWPMLLAFLEEEC